MVLFEIIFWEEPGRLQIYPMGDIAIFDKFQAKTLGRARAFWQLVKNNWSMWGGIYIQYEDQ